MNFELTTTKAFQFFYVLRQIVMIVIAILLTKSEVGQAAIGNYEMLLFLLFAVSYFWVSGSIQGFLSSYPKLNENQQEKLIFQLFLFFSGCSLLVVFFLFFGENSAVQFLTNRAELNHYHLFLIFLFFNLPTYLVENIYLLKEKSRSIVAFGLFSFVLQFVATLLPIWLGYGFRGSFIGLTILGMLKYIWLLSLLRSTARINWDFYLLRDLLKLSFPLILYALVGGFAQLFDSWLVNWQYAGDPNQFAIFRYGARELPFALAVATAFGSSMLPKLASDTKLALVEIKNKSRILFHLLFPLAVFASLTSEYFFPFVLNPDFQESYLVFNVYLLILVTRLLFPHSILISLGRNSFIFYTSVIELFINIGISIFLVQRIGLMGIAVGTVIAYAFEKVVYVVYLWRKHEMPFRSYVDVKWWGFYSLILTIAVWWSVS